jgi:hypothetical protein
VVIEQVASKEYEVILKEKSRLLNRFKNKMHCLDLEKKIHQILIYKSLKIFICLTKEKQQKQTLLENIEPLAKIIMATK